jgi:hypothetical protein
MMPLSLRSALPVLFCLFIGLPAAGHSNTVPLLLIKLGATPDCYARLGVAATTSGPEIEGYEGLWKVDLKQHGCAAITREESGALPK